MIKKYLPYIFLFTMCAAFFYSIFSGTKAGPWYILSVVIINLCFLFNVFVDKFKKPVEIIILILAPAAIFMLTETYTHDLNAMWAGPVRFNLFFYYITMLLLLFVTGRASIALSLQSAFMALVGLANYFVILFRSSPIFPWDLKSASTAFSVADNYKFTLSIRALNVLLALIFIIAISIKIKLKVPGKWQRLAGTAVMLVSFVMLSRYVQTDKAAKTQKFDTTLFTPKVYYRNNGLLLSYIINLRYLNIEKPASYSSAGARQIADEFLAEEGSTLQNADEDLRPNIIVVMNEAFSDLRILGDYETNVEVTPFIDNIYRNTQKGWYYASVKGGNTANTEFEFLTGNSLYFLPVGSVAYQQYLRSDIPAIGSQLSALGYTSIAMHPYYASGWNRNKVYDYLGFDEKYFIDSFRGAEEVRTYVSDKAMYDKLIEIYENKDEDDRLFVFDVTMQNHGSYWRRSDNFEPDVVITEGAKGKYIPSTEQFLSLIKLSDQSFEELCDYFSTQDEPCIIIMFGDHQPADYVTNTIMDKSGDDLESEQLRYKVPYVIWANYDIEEKEGEISSANYLGIKLLKLAGIPLTPYQAFIDRLSEKLPVITGNIAVDSSGKMYGRGDEALKELTGDYGILQYNCLADTKKRIADFFENTGD